MNFDGYFWDDLRWFGIFVVVEILWMLKSYMINVDELLLVIFGVLIYFNIICLFWFIMKFEGIILIGWFVMYFVVEGMNGIL